MTEADLDFRLTKDVDMILILEDKTVDFARTFWEYIKEAVLGGIIRQVTLSDEENKEVFAGCLVKTGSITLRVNKKYEESAVAKIIELISNSGEKKSKADEFIAKFAKWYTPAIVIISA